MYVERKDKELVSKDRKGERERRRAKERKRGNDRKEAGGRCRISGLIFGIPPV